MERSKTDKIVIALFLIVETVGFVGILWPEFHQLTLSLTPVNLLFLSGVLLYFHKGYHKAEVVWMLLVTLMGFLAEVAGVATGKIFGQYHYGATLGPKLWQVPLAMGINWFLMCYTSVRLVRRLNVNIWIKTALASGLMVLIDLIMEPVAMAFDFWQWQQNHIPIQNYVAWFVIAYGLNIIWFRISNKGLNNFSPWLFLYLVVFFSTMHYQFAWRGAV
ncbi:carotenoid biosynthesis protein [bacterium]|nr:carotenoid biosynthesis protein [bacterium]